METSTTFIMLQASKPMLMCFHMGFTQNSCSIRAVEGLHYQLDKVHVFYCLRGINEKKTHKNINDMQNKTLQKKRALRTTLIVLLLSAVGLGKMYAQEFVVNNLRYSINANGTSVTVIGHVDGTSASGVLIIPETVSRWEGGPVYDVTAIGDYAFQFCYDLSGDLVIPNSVVTIGESAFDGCFGFSGSLTIGNSVTAIGDDAFLSCDGFTGSLTIGNSVTTIGNSAFDGCSGLTGSLTIPNSVTSIGIGAFSSCSGFTGNLFIPNTLSLIEGSVFSGCSGFTGDLTIPNTVTYIGDYAFSGCTGLNSVFIPNSVVFIGESAFSYCSGIEQITIESSNPVYDSRNNCNAVVETSSNVLIFGCKNTVIPTNVVKIGDEAFRGCSGLTSIIIPNSVTEIGSFTFAYCTGLSSISFPNSVTGIGEFAFSGCTELTSVNIPNSVLNIGEGAFSICYSLGQIIVEAGNSIYDSRDNCNAIIETSSNTLLQGCMNTVIPSTVIKIGDFAFLGSALTSIDLPNSVVEIGNFAFEGCNSFTGSLIIPNSVVIIGDGAFDQCDGFTGSIIIGNSVTTIGESAFSFCIGATNLIIGSSVTTIGEGAFYECQGLTGDLIIPDSVITIGERVFENCGFTGTLKIGYSVSTIGNRAFKNCSGFTGNLAIPNSVTYIGTDAFRNCSGFSNELIIGNSVTMIQRYAFWGCDNLETVIALGDTPPTLRTGGFNIGMDLIVSCGSQEVYESSNWVDYFATIEEDCSPHEVIIDGNNIIGGNVSASVNSTELGEEVQLTITPDEGMELATLVVSNANNPEQTVPVYPLGGKESSSYGFIMPPFDVLITATFGPAITIGENNEALASVYPNPANGKVTIEAEDLKHITISNLLGQTVFESKASGNAFEYDFSEHKTGIYLIRIEIANGMAVKKVSVTQ